ncbi:DUF1127 domain-containing protein [Gemmobacter serpentinus]|uniref:DUF1127 domain-containing protein n=1 Tax=Gemmobacter serpentinus TaxID=2652247 RepID=UPI00124ED003|nr:DUF1127 domain-containing protein [Gemmobacter serpentinus]
MQPIVILRGLSQIGLSRLGLVRLSPLLGLRYLFALREQARSKRRLAQLDPRMLRDVGLSEAEAEEIAAQSVWDAPAHWRR